MKIEEIYVEIKNSTFVGEMKEFYNDNKLICIIVVILIFIFINKESVWDFIDSLVTLITAIAVFINISINAKSKMKGLEKIQVYFSTDKIKEDEPRFEIIRKDFTRAELAGYLSVIQKDSKDRYNIDYLTTESFFNDIYKVQKGELNEISIEMESNQKEKFKKIEKNDPHQTNI